MKVLPALVVIIAAVFASHPGHAREFVIHFSHVATEDSPKGQAATMLAKRVNRRLAGRVRMEVYANAQMYDGSEVLQALRKNTGTTGIMAAPSLSKFIDLSKELQLFDLPFLFRDINDAHRVIDSPLAKQMTEPLRKHGVHALGFWDNGMKVFSVRGEPPLRAPADFNGRRIRVQRSNIHADMIRALGAEPEILPYQHLYTELAKGTVDGQENSWSNINTKLLYEVQDWLTLSHHSYLGYLLVVGNDFWSRIPPNVRQELSEIIQDVTVEQRKIAAADAKNARQAVEAALGKDKIIALTPAEIASWKAATAGVEKKYEAEIGADLLKQVHRLLDQN